MSRSRRRVGGGGGGGGGLGADVELDGDGISERGGSRCFPQSPGDRSTPRVGAPPRSGSGKAAPCQRSPGKRPGGERGGGGSEHAATAGGAPQASPAAAAFAALAAGAGLDKPPRGDEPAPSGVLSGGDSSGGALRGDEAGGEGGAVARGPGISDAELLGAHRELEGILAGTVPRPPGMKLLSSGAMGRGGHWTLHGVEDEATGRMQLSLEVPPTRARARVFIFVCVGGKGG